MTEPVGSAAPVPVPVAPDAATARIEEVAADAPNKVAGPASPPDAAPAPDDHQEEEAARFAAQLTAANGAGRTEGDMRRPGMDLGAQIADVKTGGGVGIRGPNPGAGPRMPKDSQGVKGRITIESKKAFDDTTLRPDMVLQKIQSAYMAGLKRCYTNYLKADPTARGKVKVDLTVNEAGRTVNGRAVGFAKQIDTCMSSLMGSWRFPVPKDVDGEATEASFALMLGLVPE